jgi:hypothetical protein
MGRLTCVLAFILAIGASVALGQAAEDEIEDSLRIEWVDDFDGAQSEALAKNKLILLDFYSDT